MDPDIMLHEVKNYKLRIPPFICVGLVELMKIILFTFANMTILIIRMMVYTNLF